MAVPRSRRRSRVTLIARSRPARVQVDRHAPALDVEPGTAVGIEPDGETLIYTPPQLPPTARISIRFGERLPTVAVKLVEALEPGQPLRVALHGASEITADQLEPLLDQAERIDRHLVIELHGR